MILHSIVKINSIHIAKHVIKNQNHEDLNQLAALCCCSCLLWVHFPCSIYEPEALNQLELAEKKSFSRFQVKQKWWNYSRYLEIYLQDLFDNTFRYVWVRELNFKFHRSEMTLKSVRPTCRLSSFFPHKKTHHTTILEISYIACCVECPRNGLKIDFLTTCLCAWWSNGGELKEGAMMIFSFPSRTATNQLQINLFVVFSRFSRLIIR